jgi:hypothetical protein
MTGKRNPQLDAPEQTGAQKSELPKFSPGMRAYSISADPGMIDAAARTARLLAAAKGALHMLNTFTIDDFMEGKDALPSAELLGAIRGFEPEFSP